LYPIAEGLRKQQLQHFVPDFPLKTRFYDVDRRLAWPKAGESNSLFDGVRDALLGALYFFERDLDLD